MIGRKILLATFNCHNIGKDNNQLNLSEFEDYINFLLSIYAFLFISIISLIFAIFTHNKFLSTIFIYSYIISNIISAGLITAYSNITCTLLRNVNGPLLLLLIPAYHGIVLVYMITIIVSLFSSIGKLIKYARDMFVKILSKNIRS